MTVEDLGASHVGLLVGVQDLLHAFLFVLGKRVVMRDFELFVASEQSVKVSTMIRWIDVPYACWE